MARSKSKPCRDKHPGVSHYKREGYGQVANYTDPLTGRRRTLSLARLGIQSKSAACIWAKDKYDEDQRTRADISIYGVAATYAREKIGECVTRYLAHVKPELRPRTLATYTTDLEQFTSWCDGHGVADGLDLTTRHMMEFRRCMTEQALRVQAKGAKRGARREAQKTRAPATVSKVLGSVKAFLNWCRRAKLARLSSDDLRDTLKGVRSAERRINILTPAQIEAILFAALAHDAATANAKVNPRYRCREFAPWVLFVALTGCRAGEALALTWDSVQLDAADGYGNPAPSITLEGTATKTRKMRRIDLTICPSVVDLLRRLESETGGVGRVFVNGPETAEDVKKARMRLLSKHESPRFSPQLLRQTCASYLASAPNIVGSLYRSAAQLGHSIQVAQNYYLEALVGIPADARTLETALGIEKVARTIAGEVPEATVVSIASGSRASAR